MLPPLTRLIDVREIRGSLAPSGSAWIPLSELKSRLSELPMPSQTIMVTETGPEAHQAAEFLSKGGRAVKVIPVANWGKSEEFRMWAPNPFLEAYLSDKAAGRAVDLGCGAGREAVYLASMGWKVIAVDHLPEAIERGKSLAHRYQVDGLIDWRCEPALSIESFQGADLLTMFFFFDDAILERLNRQLDPSAILMIETFTEIHQNRFGKPASSKLISKENVISRLPDMTLLSYEEGWRESGLHTGRFLAKT